MYFVVTKSVRLFVVSLLVVIPMPVAGQQVQTKHEFWPELEIYIPITEKHRLIVSASSEKAGESGENLESKFSVAVDYSMRESLAFRLGYSLGESKGTSNSFPQHAIFVEETVRKHLSEHLLLSDRNRQEMRWLNGDLSGRFRNRLQLQRSFSLGGRSFVPYGSGEVFYDTRYSTFNRFRFIAGAQVHFRKQGGPLINLHHQQVLDLYYLWQEDSRSKTRHLRAVGVTFQVHF